MKILRSFKKKRDLVRYLMLMSDYSQLVPIRGEQILLQNYHFVQIHLFFVLFGRVSLSKIPVNYRGL